MKNLYMITADGGPAIRDLCVFNFYNWLHNQIADLGIVAICKSISPHNQITIHQDSIVVETRCSIIMDNLYDKTIVWLLDGNNESNLPNNDVTIYVKKLEDYESSKRVEKNCEFCTYSDGSLEGDDFDKNADILLSLDDTDNVVTTDSTKTLEENREICIRAYACLKSRINEPSHPIALVFKGKNFNLLSDYRK